jgi:transcriptional regulator GlxA family with amidase domain
MARRVTFLVYPDFQLLDAAGPIAAFEIAERYKPGSYTLRVVAVEPGLVVSSSGVSMHAEPLGRALAVDTLVVAGGVGSRAAALCPRTRRFIQACAIKARRTTSVCSGTTCSRPQAYLIENAPPHTGAAPPISLADFRKYVWIQTAFL